MTHRIEAFISVQAFISLGRTGQHSTNEPWEQTTVWSNGIWEKTHDTF